MSAAGTAGSLGKSWKILLREDVPGAGGGEAPAETVNNLGYPWLIMTQLIIEVISPVHPRYLWVIIQQCCLRDALII